MFCPRLSPEMNEAGPLRLLSPGAAAPTAEQPMSKSSERRTAFSQSAERAAKRGREIQENVDRTEEAAGTVKDKKPAAMQAGARAHSAALPQQQPEKARPAYQVENPTMDPAAPYEGVEKIARLHGAEHH